MHVLFEPELELPKCISFPILVLKSCDFRAGAAKVNFLYFPYDACTEKLRLSSQSCQSARSLLQVATAIKHRCRKDEGLTMCKWITLADTHADIYAVRQVQLMGVPGVPYP